MSISFSGLASGMDTSSWIEALVKIKQQSVDNIKNQKTNTESSKNTLSKVQSTFNDLRAALEKITDAKYGSNADLFSKNKTTSSKESVVTATATGTAARQSLDILVEKLATATVAKSGFKADNFISADTKFSSLSSGSAKAGNLSIYVDGAKTNIEVGAEDTIGDVLTKIKGQTGLDATVKDGKINISDAAKRKISIGSTSDTSNFASVTALVANPDGSYSSHNPISKINISAALTSSASGFTGIQKGSFKVGDATFNIDDSTTLKGLINQINTSKNSNATAYWDATAGELVLTSKTDGAFNINIENVSGNFTDVIGLTQNGNLKAGTQTLGDFAMLSINGTKLVSSSNKVTSDISGIEGLTLDLKSVSKKDEDGLITPAKINVEQQTDDILTAVKDFVAKFNTTIATVDVNTESGSALYGESTLGSIRNNLRTTVTAQDNDSSMYKLLAQIGITTGKVSNSTDTKNVNRLELDEKKFLEVLKENPDAVKEVLVGGKSNEGILNKMETIIEKSTDPASGYFSKRLKSYDTEIKRFNSNITSATSKVTAYKVQLQNKFNNMEKMIAAMQQQYSGFIS